MRHDNRRSVSLRPAWTLAVVLAACSESPPAPAAPPPPPAAAAPAPLPEGVVPADDDRRIHEVVRAVAPARIEADIRKLVSFGTRHTLSDTKSPTRGIGAARAWIHEELSRVSKDCGGCLEVVYVTETVKGGTHPRIPVDVEVVNVLAIQRGATDPDRVVMMTGDIDSRVTDALDAKSDSPGANDNASGVAGTIEAARVLSRYRFDGTIIYGALAGEEQGLFGGAIVARHAKAQGWRIVGVINNDMIGNIAGINGIIDNSTARVFAPGLAEDTSPEELKRILTTGGELDTPSRQLARYIHRVAQRYVPNLTVKIIYRLDRFGRGGHHTPFFRAGYPAVRLMETNEHYHRQHENVRVEGGVRYGDVLEGVDFAFAAKMTALNAATLASLAWAPAPPEEVMIAGAVQASTTLRWARAGAAPDLAGYRVLWREPTEPTWTRSRWIGKVNEVTLENIIIDNYFFGVAAVDQEGHQSLVVFPRPAPRR